MVSNDKKWFIEYGTSFSLSSIIPLYQINNFILYIGLYVSLNVYHAENDYHTISIFAYVQWDMRYMY